MRLFRTPFDQLNLAIPVVFMAAALSEYLIGLRSLWQYHDLLKYMQDIIFFNGLHVCLTFVLLTSTDSGRETMELFIKRFGRLGIFRVALVFFGSSAIYYVLHQYYRTGAIPLAIFYLVLAALRRRHDLGQSKGLLRIANRDFIRSHPELANDKRFLLIQNCEHYFIKVFYFSSLISVITYFDYGIEMGPLKKPIFQASLGLSILLAIGLTVCGLLSPKGTRIWKSLYSVRFYLKAFGPFSAIAAYAGASVHGTEYVFVADKALATERKRGRVLVSLLTLSVIIASAFAAYTFFRYPELFLPSVTKRDTVPLLSVAFGFIITHYHLDHLIFTPKYEFARPMLKLISEPVSLTKHGASGPEAADMKSANRRSV